MRLGISVGVEKAYVSNLLPIEVKSQFYSYHLIYFMSLANRVIQQ